jgi:uncharacterized membrane protein
MPFCSQCGSQVGASDVFCAKCGFRQPVEARPAGDPLDGITPRTASILCYVPVIGWIASIIVLATTKFRQDQKVRFHAFQGLYLFVVWLMVDWVVRPMFNGFNGHIVRLDKILQAVVMFTWIFMLIKASHEETYSLPIIGDLAQKSASEQS